MPPERRSRPARAPLWRLLSLLPLLATACPDTPVEVTPPIPGTDDGSDGTTLAPTNQPFKLDMATFGRWENGVMAEEWLFWDNQAFMKQIGAAQ